MAFIARPVNEKIINELEKLTEEFQELKNKTSDLRKKGKDTQMAEVIILDFMPKIKMAKATYEEADVEKLRKILEDLKVEIKEAEEGSDFANIYEMITDSYDYLRQKDKKKAKEIYLKIMEIYKRLPHDLKRPIYRACLDIKERIEK